jgi:hypothetical protein
MVKPLGKCPFKKPEKIRKDNIERWNMDREVVWMRVL